MEFLVCVLADTGAALASDNELAEIDAFNDRLRADGHWVFAAGLAEPSESTLVDNRGPRPIVTPGPATPAEEYLAGCWIIDAPDVATALVLATQGSQACNRRLEVRPFR